MLIVLISISQSTEAMLEMVITIVSKSLFSHREHPLKLNGNVNIKHALQ